jgi:hypothetical protein
MTCKQTLARIQRLCCLGIGGEMLMPDLMREVIALIPSGGSYFFGWDRISKLRMLTTRSHRRLWNSTSRNST